MAEFNSEYDCEPYLRALEEQADGIRGAISGILQAMETLRENAESMARTVDNLKKMIGMTRRAMVLAHGSRVLERVEIKREPESLSSTPTEQDNRPATNYRSEQDDWSRGANEPAYTFDGRNFTSLRFLPTDRLGWLHGNNDAPPVGRPLRCACAS